MAAGLGGGVLVVSRSGAAVQDLDGISDCSWWRDAVVVV
jgi:hypothetical protein